MSEDDNKERKLQIKLAKLQADIQIWLTVCFGSIALFASMLMGMEQMYFTANVDIIVKNGFLVSTFVAGFGIIFTTYVCTKQIQAKRDEMDKL